MSDAVLIRGATMEDAPVLREIYRPIVERTAISFESEVPSTEEFENRIAKAVAGWAWLVAEINGDVVGYAYGSAHRPRQAYRHSVETSAYIHKDFQRQGIARVLYVQLLKTLVEKGFGNAYAGVALPNDASMGFHETMGFNFIGVFPRVGRKFGCWHDVAWLHRPLNDSVQD